MIRSTYEPVSGATAKCCGVDANFQNVTFVVSLLVQFSTLVLSFVSIFVGDPPEVLLTIIWLETVVQLIEGAWYTTVGCCFLCGKRSIPIVFRYVDWAVTTPIMLVTLFVFTMWSADRCMTMADVRAFPSFGGYVALITAMCWLMLLIGLVYEADWPARTWLASTQRVLRTALNCPGCGYGIWLGFIPLLAAFAPHTDAYFRGKSNAGLAAILVTLVLWTLYGVNAIAAQDPQTKNGVYNVLDVFSKNAAGVVISIVSLNFNATDAGC